MRERVGTGAGEPAWSVRMADSVLARHPLLSKRWHYEPGVVLLALYQVWRKTGDQKYYEYVKRNMDEFIGPDGSIRTYRLDEYNLDQINEGKLLLPLYDVTGDERYRQAAGLLRSQLQSQPRTNAGGFWHKQIYPHQMWLDGIYMAAPFYADFARRFDERQAFDDIAHQIMLIGQRTRDPRTGLFYHGWDESKSQRWADPATGCSPCFWGRAMGWYAMAIADVLDHFPQDHPQRDHLLAIFRDLAAGIMAVQDRTSGVWYQVLDQPEREGNYREASASCMFVYALAKGVRQGYLAPGALDAARRGYAGILAQFVTVNESGLVSLHGICRGAGLGGKPYRDGSFEYYVSEEVVTNDYKGVGAFILASVEMEAASQAIIASEAEQSPSAIVEIASGAARPRNGGAERFLPFDLPPFEAPTFPGRVFDLRDFGAVDGGATVNTQAFRQAIEACHQAGGGVVRVPAGDWLSGPIHLHSNVNLHLDEGALLRFSTRPADYLPVVFTRWEGVECYNYSPLLYARDCENVAVSGAGTLDGQGRAWWPWKKRQQAAATALYDAEFEGVPVEKRVFGREEAALRPQFLQTIGCRNVLVQGVTFVNGPMWTIHPVYCENVIVRQVKVRSEGPNTDGLNPDSCRNVLVEGCAFHTGDDCIAINSGMNEDGWRVARPCENVVIRHCTMSEGHGAVAIGSGMSGGVRQVYIHDCRFTGGDQGIRLKSVRGRGGVVEQVYVERIEMANLRREAIVLDMFYGSSTAASRSDAAPVFRRIHIKDVNCKSAGAAVAIRGLPESPIEQVVLENLRLNAVQGICCQEVNGLTLRDVSGVAQQEPLLSCSNVRGLSVSDMTLERRGR